MKDRIARNPGRVLVTPENGGAAYYATITRADNPEQEGTPINKSTLLTDGTAALLGLDENATVDQAFSGVVLKLKDYTVEFITASKDWVAPENLVGDVHVIMGGGGGGRGSA